MTDEIRIDLNDPSVLAELRSYAESIGCTQANAVEVMMRGQWIYHEPEPCQSLPLTRKIRGRIGKRTVSTGFQYEGEE